MKNIALFIVSITLLFTFAFWSLLIALQKIIRGKASDIYFFNCAFVVDILGNIMGQHIWNYVFIKPNGVQFGKLGETISSVLGKNQRGETLKKMGKMIVNILDKFEKNHCLISIME